MDAIIRRVYTHNRESHFARLRWKQFDRSSSDLKLRIAGKGGTPGRPLPSFLCPYQPSRFSTRRPRALRPPRNPRLTALTSWSNYYKFHGGHQPGVSFTVFLRTIIRGDPKEVGERPQCLDPVKIETPSNHMTEDARVGLSRDHSPSRTFHGCHTVQSPTKKL